MTTPTERFVDGMKATFAWTILFSLAFIPGTWVAAALVSPSPGVQAIGVYTIVALVAYVFANGAGEQIGWTTELNQSG
jgi:hypothetical protein